MSETSLYEAMEELESAEDFLDFFAIEYDPAVVHVNRLHILQRFHNYLHETPLETAAGEPARHALAAALLERAYQDFVSSDALTEKVFKVFHMHQPQETFVPLDQIFR